ncbi:trypsin-like serine peptidase [Curtobacterium flaccumfaciens]|uniref:trypsin-like serine peptidase n=1 Tax=Curtobacterium flaccumfaciens TaxID=2035 RepID=UPI001BDE9295|nr:serine protease [Curtobacterium flaccumfaciens]MBT1631576.1 trypsin-like peptidase domain-containing protein [Curtobacterium flaccumfaciens pv. oortii]MCX2847019.1 trypsin-like peptidase domain-containing protein [Curtobacterium flaccumfaciens pv. oortii]
MPSIVTLRPDQVAETLAFWTPKRMAEADAKSDLQSHADTLETAPPVSRAARVAPVPHVGRLYLDNGTTYQTCSANAVVSANGATVATAAHCVDDFGSTHQHMLFVPAYEAGSRPFGEWPVTAYAVADGWTGKYDAHADTAFLEVASPTGRTLTDTVGASPVEFGKARSLDTTVYGYPGLPPYDDQYPYLCRGTATPAAFNDGQSIACSMNEGSSGGPWFDGSDANAPQYSVTTNRSPDSKFLYAPAWGPVIEAAYDAVQGH